VWMVTGATRGIGAEIVRAAIAAGDSVFATGRDMERLRQRWSDVPRAQIGFAQLDVTVAEHAAAAATAALARFGRIDVLVNNAGYGLLGNFEELTQAAIEQQFQTNVFGLMRVMRAVLPAMRRQAGGHIMNIASVAGLVGFGGASVYCASKFAVEGLSASVRQEVAPFGIHVTAVEPGFIRTDFLDDSSVVYGSELEGYASARAAFAAYNHHQPGDPARLAHSLVQLAAMPVPPAQFLGGSDAVAIASASLEARLAEIRQLAELSSFADGTY
jgi:NAD(P)-dependent dehydrogenase (short-subunit alcohol dehydrogenase family)